MKFETQSITDLNWKNLSGSGSIGSLFINDEVHKYLKVEDVNFALLFTYLFRRFGAPLLPHDDYKSLCCYILTTPMKDVYLHVYPCASNHNFGLIYPSQVFNKINRSNYEVLDNWFKRMAKWAKKNHGVELFQMVGFLSIFDVKDKKGPFSTVSEKNSKMYYREANKWCSTAYPQYAGEVDPPQDELEKIHNEFQKFKTDQLSEYMKVYSKIEKRPPIKSKEGLQLQKDIIKAIRATIKDLLRPTYIRDVAFNIVNTYIDRSDNCVGYFDYNIQIKQLTCKRPRHVE